MTDLSKLYRRLPSMNELLSDPGVAGWAQQEGIARAAARRLCEEALERLREELTTGGLDAESLELRLADPVALVATEARRSLSPWLRRVVNATGVIVHTNLGRAPWSRTARERLAELTGYLNLEMDLGSGERGGRDAAVGRAIERLLPGHGVAVVNNCAAAVLLVLNTFGQGKEVVVSRGQLVEIGGSFRIPDVMAKGFARLREVGTTNRTRIEDFRAAIGPDTGLLMAVHPSNYRVVGFTESVPIEQLAALGRETGIPVVEDQGSGLLVDLAPWGVRNEPTVAQRLAAGVDLVTFSGDKLLGGPQSGFIVGRPELVDRVKRNSLYRALRLDKATMAALEATLGDYASGNLEAIPVLAMLSMTEDEAERRAHDLAAALRPTVEASGGGLEVVGTDARIGGGAAPEVGVPSRAVAVTWPTGAGRLAERLRVGEPAVVGRVAEERFLLDVRSLVEGDLRRIVRAFETLAEDGAGTPRATGY